MDLLRKLIVIHGYAFVFGYVLAVQGGLPVPADPMLLVMGAMAGEGHYMLWKALLVSVCGALIGDWFWYELGRLRGHSIVKLLCRWSLEPDTCVRSTEEAFGRRGARTLLVAKFVPGMSLVSTPLAGMIRMPRLHFFLWDAAGATLWTGSYLAAGFIFHKQVQQLLDVLTRLGHGAAAVVVGALALYFGYKYFQRWRFLRAFRIGRISPQRVLEDIASGAPLTVVDLRHPLEVEREGFKIAGAIVLRPEELRSRALEIPRDQEIILYCSCPNEATSVTVALQLRKAGFNKVRPLEGGFEAWRALNLPIEAVIIEPAQVPASSV